jgi:hypothetical protein
MESHLKMRCLEYPPLILLLFPVEILLLIIKYIIEDKDISTIYSLLLSCKAIAKLIITRKEFEKKIINSARIRLLDRLNSYPNDLGRILIEMIKKEKALIAGGYILQCITGDTFEKSDIDIFISCDRTNMYEQGITNVINMLKSTFKLDCPTSPFYNIVVQNNSDYGVLKNIRRVLSMDVMGLNIQFIIVWDHLMTSTRVLRRYQHNYTPLSLEEFIKNDFDISLCKCWFNGEDIHSEDILGQVKRVGIMDSKELYEIIPKISIKEREDRMIERLEKYTRRGFTITNVTNLIK